MATENATYHSTTLRQVLQAGIPLAGGFGVDEEERGELLDQEGMMRIVLDTNEEGDEFAWVEVLEASLTQPQPDWDDCIDWPSHNSGAVERNERLQIMRRVRSLVA